MSIKKDFIKPIIILLTICFVVAGALAIINSITKPVVEENARILAALQKEKIMGEGVEFITAADDETLRIDYLRTLGLPVRITDVYRAANGLGYIFAVSIRGYGRDDLKLLCGIDMDGKIIETTPDALVITHTETQSFFNRVFSDRHLEQFWGADINSIEAVDAVSGATITSNALKNAMRYSLRAFEIVTAGQGVYNE